MLLQEAEIERLKRELAAAQAREQVWQSEIGVPLMRAYDIMKSLLHDAYDGDYYDLLMEAHNLATKATAHSLKCNADHAALDAALEAARAQEKDAQANFLDQFDDDADLYKREYWRGVCVGAQSVIGKIREATK
jgi:hypothetical protein